MSWSRGDKQALPGRDDPGTQVLKTGRMSCALEVPNPPPRQSPARWPRCKSQGGANLLPAWSIKYEKGRNPREVSFLRVSAFPSPQAAPSMAGLHGPLWSEVKTDQKKEVGRELSMSKEMCHFSPFSNITVWKSIHFVQATDA